jgi:predicted DsbA family dithiol-disulfide isomerase
MLEALFQAFFERGRDIGDIAVLQDVASSIGLDPSELGEALGAGRYTARVLEDQRIAQEIGITGVPAALLHDGSGRGQGMLLSGAVPYASLEAAVERALRQAGI